MQQPAGHDQARILAAILESEPQYVEAGDANLLGQWCHEFQALRIASEDRCLNGVDDHADIARLSQGALDEIVRDAKVRGALGDGLDALPGT